MMAAPVLGLILDRVETVEGSAYWAGYLINGEADGLSDAESDLADRWLERVQGDAPAVSVVDVGESYFSWGYGRVTGADCDGGDLVEYQVLIYREDAA